MKRIHQALLVALCAVVVGGLAFLGRHAFAAGIPSTEALSYSGRLVDVDGAPITGDRNIQLYLWDRASGGSAPLCQTASVEVTLSGGSFRVSLPDECTDAVKDNADVWVEVLVDGASLGRAKAGAVPYSVEASHALASDTARSADTAAGELRATLDDLDARTAVLEERFRVTEVLDVAGPLPVTSSMFTTRGGPVVLFVSGSAYGGSAGSVLSVLLDVDGVQKDTLRVYTNEASSHKGFVPRMIPLALAAGSHTVRLRAGTATATDGNDFFTVTVMELPH